MQKALTSPRRQQNRDAAIQQILDTARAIMREEGVAALSMQELARRCDMRAPSLYNYFSSKMDLYDSLFRLGHSLYGKHINTRMEGVTSARDVIRVGMESYLDFALQNPELYQLCFERPVPRFVPSEESLAVSVGLVQQLYQRAETFKGEMNTALSGEQIVNTLIAISHGMTALHLANDPQLPAGQGRFGSLIPIFLSVLEDALFTPGEKK